MTRLNDLAGIMVRLKALSADLHHAGGNEPAARDAYSLGADLQAVIDKHQRRSFGKVTDDDEVEKLLAGVVGCVEADTHAVHSLWCDYAIEGERFGTPGRTRYTWKQQPSGLLRQVGSIDGQPVWISLSINTVDDHRLLFYHATSNVVDNEMVREWLLANLPASALRDGGKHIHNTDATNFCNILRDRKKAA